MIARAGSPESKAVFRSSFKPTFSPSIILRCNLSCIGKAANSAARLSLVVEYRNFQSFVMADIPGIIEGASEGKGLGTRFLKHIERNASLLFMIPATSDDIKKEYTILLNELKKYNKELLDKKRLLAITKCDLISEEQIAVLKKNLPKIPHVFISSATGLAIDKLKDKLWELIN